MDESSTNTTAWFLLGSFDGLSTKSFLIWAILFAIFQGCAGGVLKSCKGTGRASLRLSSVRKVRCDATHGPRLQNLADTLDEFQLDCKSIRTSRGCWFVCKRCCDSPNWAWKAPYTLTDLS